MVKTTKKKLTFKGGYGKKRTVGKVVSNPTRAAAIIRAPKKALAISPKYGVPRSQGVVLPTRAIPSQPAPKLAPKLSPKPIPAPKPKLAPATVTQPTPEPTSKPSQKPASKSAKKPASKPAEKPEVSHYASVPDYDSMSYNALRAEAKALGFETWRVKKVALIAKLKEF